MIHFKTFLISVRNIAPEHKIQKSPLQEGGLPLIGSGMPVHFSPRRAA